MFDVVNCKDPQLVNFANQLFVLTTSRPLIVNTGKKTDLMKGAPKMKPISAIWLRHNAFQETYEEVLSTYYKPVEDYEEIKRYADKKTMEKYYPKRDGERLIKIAEDGKPSIQFIFEKYQRYVYEGATVYYTELNQLRDEILQERGKFLKNKNKKTNKMLVFLFGKDIL